MKKTASATGDLVSHQTVNNKVLSMKSSMTEIERVNDDPSELHIFTYEDHVHLRPRKSMFAPLVTVTEGMDTSKEKWHRPLNPVYFQSFGPLSKM